MAGRTVGHSKYHHAGPTPVKHHRRRPGFVEHARQRLTFVRFRHTGGFACRLRKYLCLHSFHVTLLFSRETLFGRCRSVSSFSCSVSRRRIEGWLNPTVRFLSVRVRQPLGQRPFGQVSELLQESARTRDAMQRFKAYSRLCSTLTSGSGVINSGPGRIASYGPARETKDPKSSSDNLLTSKALAAPVTVNDMPEVHVEAFA